MKKLALILAVLLLFGGVAFASDVTVSGAVVHSFGFDDGYYASGRNRATMDINAQVDAVNSLSITFEYNNLGNRDARETTNADGDPIPQDGNQPVINNAHFTTNLGAALGLDGQTLTTRIGWYEAAGYAVGNVSGAADIERVRRAGRSQNVQLDYAFGSVVRVRTVLQPGDGDAMRGLIAVAGGFGPVQAEFVYTDIGKTGSATASDDGQVEVGLLYSDNVVPGTLSLRVGANFAYRLDATGTTKETVWGVGVNAGLLDGLASLGVAFNGDEDEAVRALGIRAIVTPVDFAGLDFFVSLDLVNVDGPLSYLETSVYLKPGAATYRVGYALRGDVAAIGGDRNAAGSFRNEAGEGNIFFAASLSY